MCLPGVGDTDDALDIGEGSSEEFVGDDAAGVGEAKEGVVGED